MMRALAGLGFAVLLSCAAFGQSSGDTPAFDVADVHVRAPTSNPTPYMTGGVLRGGRYDLRNATMLDMITTAYGLDPDMVLGGPNWLERDRFDVVAKAPAATAPDTVKLMLQQLLADRFKLVVRKDTRPVSVYALTVGKGKSKLQEASGPGAGCQGQPPPPSQPGTVPRVIVSCRGITMKMLADNLRGMSGTYLTNPVTDLTGLTGFWDFDLAWTQRFQLAQAGSDGISIFDAVDQQLGLKLEQQRIPTPVLLVDGVNQKPTDNPSGVAQNLPAPPPGEFDVADIKLSAPDAPPMGRLQPGGRLDFQGITLKNLISIAWDLNDDELIAGAPKWLDTTKYTVIAKTSSAMGGAANAPQIDIDDIRLMMQALLADRFKLTTTSKTGPSLPTRCWPTSRSSPRRTRRIGQHGRKGRRRTPKTRGAVTIQRLVTARNMTMAQFAEDLQRMAPGYIHLPVADATGIDGAYDFTLSFSPIGSLSTDPGAAQTRVRQAAA